MALTALAGLLILNSSLACAAPPDFDADRAWTQLQAYMGLSPVLPASAAASGLEQYIRSQLEPLGYTVQADAWTGAEAPVRLRNLVARKGQGGPIHVIAAHYDARQWADKDADPARRHNPVPAANDGGSGVAILLELGRAVQVPAGSELWLTFLDGEDQGEIPGWSGRLQGWCLGSLHMAATLSPDARARIAEVIVVDIVGSPNLVLQREAQSDRALQDRIWGLAAGLGYSDTFQGGSGGSVTDDHVPFLELGLRVLDLIQLQGSDGSAFFPYHHTTQDTIDHVSRESLARVGKTLQAFVEQSAPTPPAPGGALIDGGPRSVLPVAVMGGLGLAAALLARRLRGRLAASAATAGSTEAGRSQVQAVRRGKSRRRRR